MRKQRIYGQGKRFGVKIYVPFSEEIRPGIGMMDTRSVTTHTPLLNQRQSLACEIRVSSPHPRMLSLVSHGQTYTRPFHSLILVPETASTMHPDSRPSVTSLTPRRIIAGRDYQSIPYNEFRVRVIFPPQTSILITRGVGQGISPRVRQTESRRKDCGDLLAFSDDGDSICLLAKMLSPVRCSW